MDDTTAIMALSDSNRSSTSNALDLVRCFYAFAQTEMLSHVIQIHRIERSHRTGQTGDGDSADGGACQTCIVTHARTVDVPNE